MTDPLVTLSELVRNLPDQRRAVSTDETLLNGNHVFHMDNLQAMAMIPAGSVDFVYLDPPFASNAAYWHEIKLPGHTIRQPAYSDVWPNGLSSYLEFLVPRIAAARLLLKPTGSLCVHLDSRGSHYIKIAMDAIFGPENLINEIIWRYGKMSNTSRRFPQNHDTLLVYGTSPDWYFSPVRSQPSEYRARFLRDLTNNQVLYGTVKHRADKLIHRRVASQTRALGRDLQDDDVLFDFNTERKVQDDVFTDISIVRGNAHEGTGYDTQKPQKLLERLISAFAPASGVVADFFSGSGTTAAAAQHLGRRWLVSDSGLPAIQVTRLRTAAALPHFHRDPQLQPTSFQVNAQGEITEFCVAELKLSPSDENAVRQTLQSAPNALIAGRIGNVIVDVFGREATLPR